MEFIKATDCRLFTIGYGNLSIEHFIQRLRNFDIKLVLDVRSIPFSRFYKSYNRYDLSDKLKEEGLGYIYLGDVIGGMAITPADYDDNRHVDYRKMAERPACKECLASLAELCKRGSDVDINIALMCCELNPAQCHRAKFIGRELYVNYNMDIKHIVSDSEYLTEREVINELLEQPRDWPLNSKNVPYFRSIKAYSKPMKL